MPLAFDDWKKRLLDAAGCTSPAVRQLGDYVLELFWKDGCEPTMHGLMEYAQAGLCGHLNIRAAASVLAEQVNPSPGYKSSEQPRS